MEFQKAEVESEQHCPCDPDDSANEITETQMVGPKGLTASRRRVCSSLALSEAPIRSSASPSR